MSTVLQKLGFVTWGAFDLPLVVEDIVSTPEARNTDPMLPQRRGKKKRDNEILQVQPILRRERKRDLSLMDRVSWCKSCITRSGNLIIQRMIEGIIPGVLSSVVQPA